MQIAGNYYWNYIVAIGFNYTYFVSLDAISMQRVIVLLDDYVPKAGSGNNIF